MQESSVTIYQSTFCPYCIWARRLLDGKGVAYTQVNVDRDREKRSEMEKLSDRTSVPQIFFGDRHIGGYDDLSTLDRNGELDKIIDSL